MTDNTDAHRLALEPADCDRLLLRAIEAGDLDAAMAIYEPDAVMLKPSGEPMAGLAAIRENFARLVDRRPSFAVEEVRVMRSGDGSLALTALRVVTRFADGQTSQSNSIEVVRRQPDGSWRIVLDDPIGGQRGGQAPAIVQEGP